MIDNLYNNDRVRRQDRLLPIERAEALITSAEFGTLSLISTDGMPYCFPINFVYEKGAIYFHCAKAGEKLAAIEHNNNACFSIVGETNVIARQYTTEYESVVIRGTVCYDIDETETLHALEIFLDKYTPNDKKIGLVYAQKSLFRTKVLRLDISHISGKCKVVK